MSKLQIISPSSSIRSDHEFALQMGMENWARLENATTTRKDDFEKIQEEVKKIQELDLIATQDLINAGLTFGANISDTLISTEDEEDFDDAQIAMNPTQLHSNDSRFNITSVPMPIIFGGFRIPWRQEAFDYKRAVGFERTTRKVMEKQDDLLINGDTSIKVTHNGTQNTIYGYTTLPGRQTTTITTAWDSATTSILADVKAMVTEMLTLNKVSSSVPQILYVPTDYETPLNDTAFANKGDRSFREQIMHQYPQIKDIRTLTKLATNNVLLVAMRSEYVQLAVARYCSRKRVRSKP
jgi:hypothetical protein